MALLTASKAWTPNLLSRELHRLLTGSKLHKQYFSHSSAPIFCCNAAISRYELSTYKSTVACIAWSQSQQKLPIRHYTSTGDDEERKRRETMEDLQRKSEIIDKINSGRTKLSMSEFLKKRSRILRNKIKYEEGMREYRDELLNKEVLSFRYRLIIALILGIPLACLPIYQWLVDRPDSPANIGGDFKLLDQDGVTRTMEDFKGNWSLFYFGYTNCPDVCPEEMDKLNASVTILKNKIGGISVVPVFVSVDPGRDDVERVKNYVKDWPGLVGLTGAADAITDISKKFKIFSEISLIMDKENYLVDHTSLYFFMSPEGKFVEYLFPREMNEEEIASWMLGTVRLYWLTNTWLYQTAFTMAHRLKKYLDARRAEKYEKIGEEQQKKLREHMLRDYDLKTTTKEERS